MDGVKDPRRTAGLAAALKYLVLALFVGLLAYEALGGRVSAATFDEVSAAVTDAAELAPMSLGGNQMLRRLYGLEPEDYDGVLLYYPTSSMSVEELLVLKLSDTAQRDAVESALQARVASQIASFEGYGPDQVAMLEKSVIEVRGNYALLVVAEDTASVLRAFENAL